MSNQVSFTQGDTPLQVRVFWKHDERPIVFFAKGQPGYRIQPITACKVQMREEGTQEWQTVSEDEVRLHHNDRPNRKEARFRSFKNAVQAVPSKELRKTLWEHIGGQLLPKKRV